MSENSVEVVRKDVIVRRRSRPAPAETAAAAPVAEAKVEEKKEAAPAAAAEPKNTAAEARPAASEDKAPAEAKAPQKARAVRPATPAARIVRPAGAPAEAKPAPAAAKIVEPAEKRPAVKTAAEPKAAAPAAAKAEKPAEAKPEVKAAPVEKKPEAAPEARREAKPAAAEEKPRSDRGRRSAVASANPEGSSQPSLLPPVQERRHAPASDEGDRRKPAPQAPADTTPRVRVISRPDPAQARIVRPAAPGESRPGNRDDRPRGDGMRRDMRDGRGTDDRDRDSRRPSGPRPGGPRPSGPRPGGAPFGAGFAQQPPMDNEQSRKKRNKTRHTTDFSQENEDFSRRRTAAAVSMPDMMDDEDGVVRTRRSHKPKKQHSAPAASTQPMKAAKRKLRVEESIRVADMAHQMGIKSGDVIKVLFGLGVMATINNALDIDTATLVAAEFGYEVEKVGFSEENYLLPAVEDTPEMLKPRPPVVTIMGHVDHGKTSLLDAIRKTSVTSGEAGGITQHIGAYHVRTKRGDIVFLDTPGHAAFTAMRARGAQVTDLVVLVVAADDGVMEQTREAINHSRAAGVPILVAVNKIDKETANPDRVLRELSELGLQPEDWGGDTVVGMVSAKTGKGLDDLLELIALQAEILELKANPDKPARGHVVEAKLDKGRGPVATVLVQEGTIHQGDVFVCGVYSGRVRALFNDQGRKIKEAGPSMPVEIQGFEGVPEAGEEFVCLEDEKTARRIAETRAAKLREKELAKVSRVTLENFLKQSADSRETLALNVVLKADVQGSLEAITESLRKLSTEKVRIEIIHGGAGAIS
ncbi:MAG: translation initiation factor IF-2, partial [Mailhella sp.]|nr:translation initiation factor IF-2 [Mailhella sp.]